MSGKEEKQHQNSFFQNINHKVNSAFLGLENALIVNNNYLKIWLISLSLGLVSCVILATIPFGNQPRIRIIKGRINDILLFDRKHRVHKRS